MSESGAPPRRTSQGGEKGCHERSTQAWKPKVVLRGAVTAWGLKDTSSRPPKDLGGTLRRTSKTTLRSYDSRASGDQECPYRQGRVANVTKATDII